MFPGPTPDPCSLHDEWLKQMQRELGDPEKVFGVQELRLTLGNLVATLRAAERERVSKILSQV